MLYRMRQPGQYPAGVATGWPRRGERRSLVPVTEPAPDLDREVDTDSDDDAVLSPDAARDQLAERARQRAVENDARLLEERPPHW